jgi:hypothetical protein
MAQFSSTFPPLNERPNPPCPAAPYPLKHGTVGGGLKANADAAGIEDAAKVVLFEPDELDFEDDFEEDRPPCAKADPPCPPCTLPRMLFVFVLLTFEFVVVLPFESWYTTEPFAPFTELGEKFWPIQNGRNTSRQASTLKVFIEYPQLDL